MARQRRGLTLVLLAALLCAASLQFASPAQAKSFTVCPSGCDFTTIAAALQAASDGDTIAIGEGAYAGGVEVSKNVTLRGAGRDKTTIQGTSAASVIRVKRVNVAIEAVTITGGGGSPTGSGSRGGGGILNEGELILRDSIVRANTVASGEGGGIYSHASKPLEIRDSIITENQATDGGGIFIRNGDVEVSDTTFSNNRSTRNGGGIVHQGGETLRLERCDITANRAGMDVGGVLSSSKLVLVESTVTGNSAVNVGGLAGGRELLDVVRSTIRGNISTGSGGGIRVGSGGVALVNSMVEKNQSRGANGGGIFASNLSGDVSLRNSTIAGNIAAQDGGGILVESQKVDLDNSKIIDNQAGRQGGGIYSRSASKSQVKLSNGSVISGNQPNQCFPATLRCEPPRATARSR